MRTRNMRPARAQLSPGLPGNLPNSCRCSQTSLLCVHKLGGCPSKGRSPAGCVRFGAAAQPHALYAPTGQVWLRTQREASNACASWSVSHCLLKGQVMGNLPNPSIPRYMKRGLGWPGLVLPQMASPAHHPVPSRDTHCD